MSALDLRLLGRLGGAGLLAGAVALFVLTAVPRWDSGSAAVTITVAILTAIGGIVALRTRWRPEATRAGMVLTGGAYVALGVSGCTGGSQAAYGPLFVVVAAWCGLALGPAFALKLSPLALLCDTLPAWFGRPGTALTGFGAVAVATLTGEIFARLADRVRHDARRDAHRTEVLERLTAGQVKLAQATDPHEAAAIAAIVARDILDAGETAVHLERDGERIVLGHCDEPRRTPHSYAPSKPAFEVPLSGRDGTGVRGVLVAYPRPGHRLDPFGCALAVSLAAATCAALESIALNARLRIRAEVDPLTGLGNRRRLETALSRLQPKDLVVVLDLDHFKAVNDTFGHDMGDEVLRAFGNHLSSATRAGELAIRTGGEEFVLIVEAGERAETAAALLSRLAAGWWRQSPLTTFSAGAAVHHGGDPATTMRLADQALYEAKRRGRAAGWLHEGDLAGGELIAFPGQPFAGTAEPASIVLPRPASLRLSDAVL